MKLSGNEREMNDEYKSDKISNSIRKFFFNVISLQTAAAHK